METPKPYGRLRSTTSDKPSSPPCTSTTSSTKLQPALQHPLEDHTASLLRLSKSMMDDLSPSSALSDDELSVEHTSGSRQSPPDSPSLQSLQRKPIPPIPDEQDRKRFIGCLAAVLASAYDYDDAPRSENDLSAEQASAFESRVFHEDDEVDLGKNPVSLSSHSTGSFESSDAGMNSSFDESMFGSTKSRQRTSVSAARHRKRRYDVLSNLLVSSAELMQVDKSQAKAFLPMLSKLLVPEGAKAPTRRRPSSRCLVVRPSSSRSAIAEGENMLSDPGPSFADDLLQQQLDRIEHLRPFLKSMTPGAGFRCLTVFLLQHLLNSPTGYDARIRHSLKVLAVLLLVHDMEYDPVDVLADFNDESKECNGEPSTSLAGGMPSGHERRFNSVDRVAVATRKFEALEHYIATKLLQLSKHQERENPKTRRPPSSSQRNPNSSNALIRQSSYTISREQVMRGLKIGGTAVLAGTLFALTGGLAAPGIAAGVAALAGGGAAAAATAVLTSTAAVTAIFGVGGGSLAAYKMQRRTQGLTSFEFHKESGEDCVDLFLTVAISGWLRDKHDFQRPWGVSPSNPPIRDRLELLERFYSVQSPDHVAKCKRILKSWEGQEDELWRLLAQKYGRDPSHLFPLQGPRQQFQLTLEQKETIELIFEELGYVEHRTAPLSSRSTQGQRPLGRDGVVARKRGLGHQTIHSVAYPRKQAPLSERDSLHGPISPQPCHGTHYSQTSIQVVDSSSSIASSGFDSLSTAPSSSVEAQDDASDRRGTLKHLSTVWDYRSRYGGELYTVKWEDDLMIELCDSVSDLAFELVSGGTAQILKHTALSTIMSAIAWPYALVNAANMIDGTWTLAVERADEAGRELARSLLFSRAGHRPVTLIGFSFGARAIYACLKELAMYQQKWESFQEGAVISGVYQEDGEKGEDSSTYKTMREPASIVEDAILMGLPNHLSTNSWMACRQVVAGRLINCYSQKDLVLSLMFQFKRLGLKPVCGTCPVNVSGVENVEVTDLVTGHEDYCLVTGEILKRVRHGVPFHI